VVLLGASRDDNAKVTLLLSPPGADRPLLAVKTATTDGAARRVLAETEVLLRLQRLPLAELRATVPSVREVLNDGGRPALVTDLLPGTPMSVGYHRWRHTSRRSTVARDLGTVLSWLRRFQDLTAGPSAPVTWADELHGRLLRRHRTSLALPAGVAALQQAAEQLVGVRAPRTAVHGDLWVGNVLAHHGRVTGVVDWESAALVGEPLRDLARLVLSYALYLDRHTRAGRPVHGHTGLRADSWGAGVRHALSGSGWFPELVQESLRDGLAHLGVDPGLWHAVAACGLAEIAVTADEPAFAEQHLSLLGTVWRRPPVLGRAS
jgi:aminoglycoside phosphotransferase